jgi:hypothetical protein
MIERNARRVHAGYTQDTQKKYTEEIHGMYDG